MTIFFDLDGTLVDSKPRLYHLFQELVPQSTFTFNEYWSLKQKKISHSQILRKYFKFTPNDILVFEQDWMCKIESDEFLKFDSPIDGIYEYLLLLKESGVRLYIVTARQFKDKVLEQIGRFGWNNIFVDILVTEQKLTKVELIQSVLNKSELACIIGDTGKDIQVGKYLAIKTVAVLSGFLNKKSLLPYNPDLIVDSIVKLNIKDLR